MKRTKTLRKMVEDYRNRIVLAPGVHDPLSAKIAEKMDFDALYMSGAATSLSRLGMPDYGLITESEIVQNARSIVAVTKKPLMADADTGYGNALNMMRTIRDYIGVGVAGVHVEDQVWPKRCGHLKGKLVISAEEMVGRIRAASRARDEEDGDFVLIARTDVRGVKNGSMEKAISRLKRYVAAGADAAFADGIISREELESLVRSVDAPVLFHPTGISPRLTRRECEEMGVGILIYPFASIHAAAVSVWNFLEELKKDDTEAQVRFEKGLGRHPIRGVRELFDLAGLKDLQRLEREYLTGEEIRERYAKSVGL